MVDSRIIEELSLKIKGMYRSSPASDWEESSRALLQGVLSKLELVSRDEFDVQADLLRDTRRKLDVLQDRVDLLEKSLIDLENLLHKRNN